MMKAKEMSTKENRAYVAPMCSIFMMVDEPLMAGSGDGELNPPSGGETDNPNPAKLYNNTGVWDED